jgi:ATP-dependent protease HslVU (ClpYQ) ATPase subunit
MINQKFSENLSLLTDKLNKTKFEKTPTSRSFPSNRLRSSVFFLLEKKEYFSKNLNDLTNELNQMKNDALKLFKEFASSPEAFQIVSYIKTLIEITEQEEIDRSSNNINHLLTTPVANTSKKEKIKIFKSASAQVIETDMNKFLSENNVRITRTMQNTDNNMICITIFYKEKNGKNS